MRSQTVSIAVIRRLPRYYRCLGTLLQEGHTRISSRDLANRLRLTASQIRQDLNCFGGFGQQGYGYNVEILRQEIGKILGLEQRHKTIIVGAGNLAHAFASHMHFVDAGFEVVAAFDRAEQMVGSTLAGYPIHGMDELDSFCRENGVDTAILCIPEEAAPVVLAQLSKAGIRGVWNFTNYDITAYYPDMVVENVQLSDSLMSLCYLLNERPGEEKAEK